MSLRGLMLNVLYYDVLKHSMLFVHTQEVTKGDSSLSIRYYVNPTMKWELIASCKAIDCVLFNQRL